MNGLECWAEVDISSPLFWSSLYNFKCLYGLACFPFLVFELPLAFEALTKCCPTAYNQTGHLVVKLAKSDVATLYERRQLAKAKEDAAAKAAQWKSASSKLQA